MRTSWWVGVSADKFRDAAKQRDSEMRTNVEWRQRRLRTNGHERIGSARRPRPRARQESAE